MQRKCLQNISAKKVNNCKKLSSMEKVLLKVVNSIALTTGTVCTH